MKVQIAVHSNVQHDINMTEQIEHVQNVPHERLRMDGTSLHHVAHVQILHE